MKNQSAITRQPGRLPYNLIFAASAMAFMTASAQTPPMYKDPAASVEVRVDDLLARLSTDEKISLLGGTGFTTQPVERLGIPALKMSDGPCGVRGAGPSTAYTAGVCLAASWNRDLAQRVGTAMGRDARARGIHVLLAPGMNLYRAPMCGRNFEYFGEDPLLAGMTAASFVRGVQGQGVAATIKHFAANNQEFQRHDLSSDADERTLRELYLRGFQIAVREGQPACVMNSYNPINGVHATQNAWLNNDVLKGEWGFRGLLMSDWDACYDTLGMANGGLDLEMPTAKFFTGEKLRPLLDAGRVTPATLDDKIRRLLRVAFGMGWFDRAQQDRTIARDDPANLAVNEAEAAGGITLLKNEGNLLPLDRTKVKSVVVLGPNASVPVTGGGGSAFVSYFHALSVESALRAEWPSPGALTVVVWQPEQEFPAGGQADLDAIGRADAVVVCVGFNDPGCFDADHGSANEREEHDRRYTLPPGQPQLIQRVAKLNPRTVVVLNAGGSVATASWIGQAAALLHAYYPGSQGNAALAKIIFGELDPSGKLPFSWEKGWEASAAYGNYPDRDHPKANTYREGVFLGYRWFDAKNVEPLFPFGFGLSYTRFELSDFKAASNGAGGVEFLVTVRNAGPRAGAEVVQVYAAPPAGTLPRPPRELKAYQKVFLEPGMTQTVTMSVKPADLATWDPAAKKWVPTPGESVFQTGESSRHLPLRATLTL